MSDTPNTVDEELMRLAIGEPDEGDEADQREPEGEQDGADDEGDEEEGEGGEKGEGGKGKTRSKRWQSRVDTLTARNHNLERQLAEAQRRLAGDNGNEAPAKAPEEPDPGDYEFGDADPAFLKALVKFERESADYEREGQMAAQRAHSAISERLNLGAATAEVQGQAKYEDFAEKVAAAVESRAGEPLPPVLGIALSISPVGGDLIYRLATDEAASAKLEALAKGGEGSSQAFALALGEMEGEYVEGDDDADLDLTDSLDMARMLGRMRARLKGGVAREGAPAGKLAVTNAPVPPDQRVRGGAGRFEVSDDTENFAAFEKKHMAKRK